MPITDLASYLPTADEFIAHWSRVNADLDARGEPPAVLRDGRTLEEFCALRAELEKSFGRFKVAEAHSKVLQEERSWLEGELRARLTQFRCEVMRLAPESSYADRLRTLPLEIGDPRCLGQLDAIRRLWADIDGDPALQVVTPLELASGYRFPHFQAATLRFRRTCRELRAAVKTARGLQRERDALCGEVMRCLAEYRCVVRFDLDVRRELLAALPARTPSSYRPGSSRDSIPSGI